MLSSILQILWKLSGKKNNNKSSYISLLSALSFKSFQCSLPLSQLGVQSYLENFISILSISPSCDLRSCIFQSLPSSCNGRLKMCGPGKWKDRITTTYLFSHWVNILAKPTMSHHIKSWPLYPPWDLLLWNEHRSQTELIQIVSKLRSTGF